MHFTYDQLQTILKNESCPAAFCDLEAFDQNLKWLGRALESTNKKVRLGTKSIRIPALINRALQQPYVNGLMIFYPNEIQYWQENFDVIDFLLAYPIITETDAIKLCTAAQRNPNVKITAMVDSIQHLEILETCAKNADVTLSICIDCDMGFPFLTQWAGVLRSPLNSIEKIINFAHESEKYPHLVFRGIMGYEVEEAGTSDQSFIMRKMKAQSRQSVNQKRKEIIIALKDAGFNPELVNGGGSGCFQKTAEEPDITEIGLGSGLIKSYIFDPIESMHNFQPSLFMALRIVRSTSTQCCNCLFWGILLLRHWEISSNNYASRIENYSERRFWRSSNTDTF